MNDPYRTHDDRYSDRYAQDDYRSDSGRGSYSRDGGQDRYRDRSFASDRSGYGERSFGGDAYAGGGQRYGGGRGYEDRGYGAADRGQDPYGAAYGGYGEDVNRDRRYGADPRDQQSYGNRQASGAMMHQGYRAPIGGVRGDAQGYSNAGYSQGGSGLGGYVDNNRYQYNDYHTERNRDGAGYGARDFANQGDRGFWEQTRDEVSSWFGDDAAAHRRQMDDARDSLHRGRGPKGYTRSDDRIREDVNDRLTDDHRLDASDIEAKVSNGEVTLSGHVDSRESKRRAEDIADRVAGVKHVQNNLRVQDRQSSSAYGASTAASGQFGGSQAGATSSTSHPTATSDSSAGTTASTTKSN